METPIFGVQVVGVLSLRGTSGREVHVVVGQVVLVGQNVGVVVGILIILGVVFS